MGSLELVQATEVLDPDDLTLGELAEVANREHDLVIEAGVAMVEHAVRCGWALNAAFERVPSGGWDDWLADNFPRKRTAVRSYRRLARYQEHVRDAPNVAVALHALRGFPDANVRSRSRIPDAVREEAIRLVNAGNSREGAAQFLGVSPTTVSRWVDPSRDRRLHQAANRRDRERRAAAKALERAEREQTIKHAVRKAGAAEQELYAMAERMQDVMGQAHREATDPEKRRHYALAGEHYRAMRDEIVRALGVS